MTVINKLTILLFILLFSISLCNADDFWKDATGVVSPAEIRSLEVDSKGTVYALSNGTINRSIDGGENWSVIALELPSVFSNSANLIKCDNEDNLVIFNGQGIFILEPDSDTARFALGATNISIIIAVTKENEIICSNYSGALFVLNRARTELTEINLTKEYHPDLADIRFQYDDNYGIIKILEFRWRIKERSPIAYHTLDYGKTWQLLEFLPNSNIKFEGLRILDSKYWLYLPENAYNQWELWDISNGLSVEIDEDIIDDSRFIDYSRDGEYFLRNSKNLYKYSINDMKWNKYFVDSLNLFGSFNVWGFATDNDDNIYVGDTDRRFMKYSKKNELWTEINLETNVNISNGFKKVGSDLFASDNNKYIFRSSNKGQTWDRIQFPNIDYYSDYDINIKGEIIAVGRNNIFYSSDFGDTWIEIDTSVIMPRNYPNKVRIFDDSSIYFNGFYMKNINSNSVRINLEIDNVVRLTDGRNFGISSNHIFLANNDFSKIEFIDSTISELYPKYINLISFALGTNDSIYLATSRGLFVSPGFVDKWTFVDFPRLVSSVSIDDNDIIYLTIPVSTSKDSIIYSDDNAKTWKTIGISNAFSFLAFGDGDLVISQGRISYAKVDQEEYLYVETKVEQDVWYDKNGIFSCQVRNEDNIGIESAAIIFYKPWINEYDTLYTDKYGKAKLEIESASFNSNVNTYKQLIVWVKKDGYQTTNTLSQNIFYIAESKDLTLTHINSYYPINFDKHYYLCTVDSTVNYEMVIYNEEGNVVKGNFNVENQLLGINDSFEQKDDDFASYNFNIPYDTPLGMYKLSFSAKSLSNNKSTSLYETFIIVTDSIPDKYFGLGYEPYPTELISPVDDSIVGINPTLEWYRVQYADSYLLRVSKTKIFPIYYSELVFNELVYNNSIVLEGLEVSTTYYWKVASQVGYTDYDYNMTDVWSFTTSNISGVESEIKDNIFISPNPFTEKVTVSGEFRYLELHDMKGNVLYRKSFDNISTHEYELNTSELASGTYFIIIDSKPYKIVKTR